MHIITKSNDVPMIIQVLVMFQRASQLASVIAEPDVVTRPRVVAVSYAMPCL